MVETMAMHGQISGENGVSWWFWSLGRNLVQAGEATRGLYRRWDWSELGQDGGGRWCKRGTKLTLHAKVAGRGWLKKGRPEEEERRLQVVLGQIWRSFPVVWSSDGVVEVLDSRRSDRRRLEWLTKSRPRGENGERRKMFEKENGLKWNFLGKFLNI